MQTITIELLNEKALNLLRQLEQLDLLRLILVDKESPKRKRPSRQWAGTISAATADRMLEASYQSRDEWDRNI